MNEQLSVLKHELLNFRTQRISKSEAERNLVPHPGMEDWILRARTYASQELGYTLINDEFDSRLVDAMMDNPNEGASKLSFGITNTDDKTLWVDARLPIAQRFLTTIHELGHAMMEKGANYLTPRELLMFKLMGRYPERIELQEVKANAFAYIVGKGLGTEHGYLSAKMALMDGATPEQVDKIASEAESAAETFLQYLTH